LADECSDGALSFVACIGSGGALSSLAGVGPGCAEAASFARAALRSFRVGRPCVDADAGAGAFSVLAAFFSASCFACLRFTRSRPFRKLR